MASKASRRQQPITAEDMAQDNFNVISNTVDEPSEDPSYEFSEEQVQVKKMSSVAFEINKAPRLEDCDRDDLVTFMQKYKRYLEVFEEAGADGMEPRSLKSMIKTSLLKAICKRELKNARRRCRGLRIVQLDEEPAEQGQDARDAERNAQITNAHRRDAVWTRHEAGERL